MEFSLTDKVISINEAKQLNPLALAFIGDAVYEVFVRGYLINNYRDLSPHKLHVKAISFVKAHSQSEFIKRLEDKLTEEEYSIFKRGRNAKSGTVPKNADVQEYRMATGLEALVGFLYITNQRQRLKQLLDLVIIYSLEEGVRQ